MAEQPETLLHANNEKETNLVKRALTRLSLNIYQNKSNNKDIFDFATIEKNLEECNYPELDAFEAHSIQEDSEWESLIKNVKRTRAEQKRPLVDMSALPSEQREYLEQAPSLQTFINDSLEFQNTANTFLNLHVKEMLEIKSNLMRTCKRHLSEQQAALISENLANLTPKDKDKPPTNTMCI